MGGSAFGLLWTGAVSVAAKNPNVMAVSLISAVHLAWTAFQKNIPTSFWFGLPSRIWLRYLPVWHAWGLMSLLQHLRLFTVVRASEQVRMNMGYMHEPVKQFAPTWRCMGFLRNSLGWRIAVMRTYRG